jgi:hypothetical protein
MAAAAVQALDFTSLATRVVRAKPARAHSIACLSPVAPATGPKGEQTELDEAELLRRARISSANAGKVPWNKGRKHSAGKLHKARF